jgi:hypothetical protein
MKRKGALLQSMGRDIRAGAVYAAELFAWGVLVWAVIVVLVWVT